VAPDNWAETSVTREMGKEPDIDAVDESAAFNGARSVFEAM
jgi:hypothetical protein